MHPRCNRKPEFLQRCLRPLMKRILQPMIRTIEKPRHNRENPSAFRGVSNLYILHRRCPQGDQTLSNIRQTAARLPEKKHASFLIEADKKLILASSIGQVNQS